MFTLRYDQDGERKIQIFRSYYQCVREKKALESSGVNVKFSNGSNFNSKLVRTVLKPHEKKLVQQCIDNIDIVRGRRPFELQRIEQQIKAMEKQL